MTARPICEPVELPAGTSVIAERVVVEPETADVGNFLHFHDVAELVLFKRVRGRFISGGGMHALGDGSVVFVPSMRHHDFALEPGTMEWVLIQFDPDIVEALAGRAPQLQRPICVALNEPMAARLALLADWLVDAAATPDPKIEAITRLLLLAVAEAAADNAAGDAEISPVERLLPSLELLRMAPEETITLEHAATTCRMSPAYFSRRFRQLLGMTFSDYARSYRLRLAARRLASSGASISEIAYGVGFSSPAHFGARFRERFGMTPRQYRASARTRAAAWEGKSV